MAAETSLTHISLASAQRGYGAIKDYGLIGDCRTVALVATDASIDWLCLPHFDSQAVLSRLIGAERGGYLSLTEADDELMPVPISQHYRHETAILETEVGLREGRMRVTDFMPMDPQRGPQRPEMNPCVVRRISALESECRFALRMKIAPDYARAVPVVTVTHEGAMVTGGHGVMVLSHADHKPESVTLDDETQGPLTCVYHLQAGEHLTVVLGWAENPYLASKLRRSFRCDWEPVFAATEQFWHAWSAKTAYNGPYRDAVARSAITLKLLTFAPTGAMVAAPTTSLPELIGGSRNWDYRYTWIRDGSLAAGALASLGHLQEALDFVQWVEHRERKSDRELRVMYGIRGERHLPEIDVAPLDGYKHSRPVRVGNGAVDQHQLDIYGEWLDCVARVYLHPDAPTPEDWLCNLVDATATFVCDHWIEQDAGIWEVRSGAQNFVYSKVMCWAAVDRAIQLAERYDWPVDIPHWERVRAQIFSDVTTHGFDEQTGAFKIAYEMTGLDAATLMVPIVGFLPPHNPHVIATTNAIARDLTDAKGFVYRYRHFDDGVGGEEGTFIMCSYWLAENLALQQRRDEAVKLFEKIYTHASPTGLISEMIDSSNGELLGNYPQAFSHLGLIRTALVLQQLDEGLDTEPWTRSQILEVPAVD